MRLYVCWGTFALPLYEHHCHTAHAALRAAGHDPEVVHAHSFGAVPGLLQTPTRHEVKAHTGEYWVPALELPDGTWVTGTAEIVAWAREHPVGPKTRAVRASR